MFEENYKLWVKHCFGNRFVEMKEKWLGCERDGRGMGVKWLCFGCIDGRCVRLDEEIQEFHPFIGFRDVLIVLIEIESNWIVG